MNREILFRGKVLDTKQWKFEKNWVEGNLIYFPNNESWIIPLKSYDWADDGNCLHFDRVEVIPETVGQFTGLTDKNGTKIFEGDVFTSHHYPFQDDGERNYDAIVEWIESGWQYVLTCVNSDKQGISEGINHWLGDDGSQIEVIGNIHDK